MFKILLQNKEFMTVLTGFASTGLIGISMGAKLFLESRYRSVIECKDKDGNNLSLDTDINNLIDRVLNRIQLESRTEVNLIFFATTLGDPVHFGSLQTVFRAHIGLPKSFLYKTRADVDNIFIAGSDLNMSPNSAAALMDSLFITDKAKAFAIAREIFYVNSFTFHVDVMLKSLALLGTIFASYYTRNFFQLRRRLKPWSRGVIYSLIGGMLYSIHLVLMDAYANILDVKVDKKAAQLTLAYAEGGVEYYNKLLLRNKLVHNHTQTGSHLYTATGNEKLGLIRHRHANISARLKVVKDELIRMKDEAEKEADEKHIVKNENLGHIEGNTVVENS